jgi:hypothetical protein
LRVVGGPRIRPGRADFYNRARGRVDDHDHEPADLVAPDDPAPDRPAAEPDDRPDHLDDRATRRVDHHDNTRGHADPLRSDDHAALDVAELALRDPVDDHHDYGTVDDAATRRL